MSVQIIMDRDIYLDSPVTPVTLTNAIYAGDADAQRIRFRCFQKHGQIAPMDLSEITITAHFIRPDGGDVVITGTGGSTYSYVDLPEACYVYPGIFKLLVRASTTDPDVVTSVLYVTGRIDKPTTDVIIDPGTTIPSLEDLLAQIDACEAAEEAANAAAASATAAAAAGVRTDTDAQGLTDTQKANARTNIGAADAAEVSQLSEEIETAIGSTTEDIMQTGTEYNYYVASDEKIKVSSNWQAYYHIINEADYAYELTGYTNNATFYNVCFYSTDTPTDASYLGGLQLGKVDALDTIRFSTDVIPVGTKGILFCSRTATGEGTVINAYVSNKTKEMKELTDEVNLLISKAEEDISDDVYKKTTNYINSNGVLTNSANWEALWFKTSKLLNIKTVSTYGSVLTNIQIGFYSSLEPDSSSFISGISFTSTTEKTISENVSIPANAVLVIITNRVTSGTDITITGIVKDNCPDSDVWSQYDGKFNLIGYSRVNNPHNYVINTVENYNYVGSAGYDGIKGDLRITSDDQLVMCHDAGFTLDNNGEIIAFNSSDYTPIRSMTLAEVQALVFAQKTDTGESMNVPTFEEFVRVCKKWGKFCFPTLRDEYIDTILPLVFSILDKYDMRNHTIVNSMTYDTLVALREIDAEIPVTYTKDIQSASLTDADIRKTINLGNSGFGFFAANGAGTTPEQLETKIIASQSQINLAKENGVRIYGAIATMSMYEIMLSYGFSGTAAVDVWE